MPDATNSTRPIVALLPTALALAGLLEAQTTREVPNLMFLGATGGRTSICDQSGWEVGFYARAQVVGAPRITANGTVWFVLDPRTAGNRNVVTIGRSMPGSSAWDTRWTTPALSAPATAIAVTRENHAVVVADDRSLTELDEGMGIVGTWPLAGIPTTLEVDEQGDVWIGIRNQPAPLLQIIDRASGASRITTINGGTGDVLRIVPDGRAGGSRVFVSCAGSPQLFEFDGSLQQLATHTVPDATPGSSIEELELAPDGTLWAAARGQGVWWFDPMSARFERLRGISSIACIGFDAHGTLWVMSDRLVAVDARRREIDIYGWGYSGYGAPRAIDPGGLFAARVLDPRGDADGDGIENRIECEAWSNPYDPQSTPSLALHTRVHTPNPGAVRGRIDGAFGAGALLLATGRANQPLSVPGISGAYELDLAGTIPVAFPTPVPGDFRIELPLITGIGTARQLWVQAVGQPLFGTPRWSDSDPFLVRRTRTTGLVESFFNDVRRDDLASAGPWTGGLRPGRLGGRGLLGDFDPALGTADGPNRFVFDTDDQLVPGSHTLTGNDIRVTDGVFEFASFVIPAGVTVAFRGSAPLVLRVRGDIRIDGILDLSGASAADAFDPRSVFDQNLVRFVGVAGQAGAPGGPGGGAGGDGATGSDGNGDVMQATGRDGRAVQVPGRSGYAGHPGIAATAGRGAQPFPADAMRSSVAFRLFNSITVQTGAGGSGGSWLGGGTAGRVLSVPTQLAADRGPPTPPGAPLPFIGLPGGVASLEHFLIGGAGGGAGGSHAVNMSSQMISVDMRAWHAGAGGGGGGGAAALRAGDELVVGAQGAILARGGASGLHDSRQVGPPMPGGGGSGGSLLLQTSELGLFTQNGHLDVSGGAGGISRFVQFNGVAGETRGGDGGHGLVRFESPQGGSTGLLGTVQGPATLGTDNIGVLAGDDPWSGARSNWIAVSTPPAAWLRYRVTAEIAGQTVVFSDDPSVGVPADQVFGPLLFLVQAGVLDPASNDVRASGPPRTRVAGPLGLATDPLDHVRWEILFHRAITTDVRVTEVRIEWRE